MRTNGRPNSVNLYLYLLFKLLQYNVSSHMTGEVGENKDTGVF